METSNETIIWLVIIFIIFFLLYYYYKLDNDENKYYQDEIEEEESDEDILETQELKTIEKTEFEKKQLNKLFKKHGFCKLENYISKDFNFLIDYTRHIEKKYPKIINNITNNPRISNNNRKSIPFTGKLYSLNIEKQLIWDEVENVHTNYPNNKIKRCEYTNRLIFEKEIEKDKDLGIQLDKYYNSENYTKMTLFLENLIKNLRKDFPNIVKKNLKLYWAFCFYIYPPSKSQEIHMDKFFIQNHEGDINQPQDCLQIFIPLHDTPIECGPTVLYDKNLVDNTLLDKYNLNIKIDKKDPIVKKNPEILKMFEKAKVQYEVNKGDIIFVDGDTFHKGGGNKSNITRKTLLIQMVE